jgi:hypothetical protein
LAIKLVYYLMVKIALRIQIYKIEIKLKKKIGSVAQWLIFLSLM